MVITIFFACIYLLLYVRLGKFTNVEFFVRKAQENALFLALPQTYLCEKSTCVMRGLICHCLGAMQFLLLVVRINLTRDKDAPSYTPISLYFVHTDNEADRFFIPQKLPRPVRTRQFITSNSCCTHCPTPNSSSVKSARVKFIVSPFLTAPDIIFCAIFSSITSCSTRCIGRAPNSGS